MGKVVDVSDTDSAFMSLFASILSVITCTLVVLSIYLDKRTKKKSYHLRLVQRLLLSDIGLSMCVILYYVIQLLVDSRGLKVFCNLYLPTVVYFFLCSYGWTVMLAFRFRSSHQEQKIAGPPTPLYIIWSVPFPLALAVLIAAFSTGSVTTVEANDVDTNQSCTFNHSSVAGIALDLITFQGPLLLTILVNCYSYTKGLLALSNTPHSVMARQMRKAGGYLGVLLIVWVPNIVYNFMSIFSGGSDEDYNGFLDLVIFLTSLQGFLNVCVYVWSNQQMRSWFWRHMFCVTLFRKPDPSDPQVSERPSTGGVNPLFGGQDGDDCSDNEDDEDEEGGQRRPPNGLRDSLSVGAHMQENGRGSASTNGTSSSGSGRDTGSSAGSKGSKTKSILIPSTASKVVDKKSKGATTHIAASVDLDSERYVRFGENQTRLISVASTPRPSEQDLESIDVYDDV